MPQITKKAYKEALVARVIDLFDEIRNRDIGVEQFDTRDIVMDEIRLISAIAMLHGVNIKQLIRERQRQGL